MTSNSFTTQTAKTTDTARVEQLLRDAAFVLKMTRKVKQEILRDRAVLQGTARAAEQAQTALGV
jgi:hypothetical protein